MKKKQSKRLTNQHKASKGVKGIFGKDAKLHDLSVGYISKKTQEKLESEFPDLNFRYRKSIRKSEINAALKKIDESLGQTLFVTNASIKPDGGLIEVQDKNNELRFRSNEKSKK